MYEVRRAVGDGPMEFVGTVGKRKFLDRAIPAADLARALEQGRGRVLYEVTAIRSTSRGVPAQFGVRFGAPGVAGTAESATLTSSGRRAA